MPILNYPIIVISYSDEARSALVSALRQFDVDVHACPSFIAAEDLVLQGVCSGLVIDLTSIVKAKGEEKVVACSLMNVFPSLRVKAVGTMLVPMTMPGQARQDGSLKDFLTRTCSVFAPRKLRSYRRHALCLPTLVRRCAGEARGFTLNVSWGGAFIVDMYPEHVTVGEELVAGFPELGVEIPCIVCWLRPWGERYPPGFGVRFLLDNEALQQCLGRVLRQGKESDRDRVVV
jgi:hypothetical protein